MGTRTDDEDMERRRRLARFYARRERYQREFRKMGMMNIYFEVRRIEADLNIRFDRRRFFEEVNNPSKCLIIEDT